jgi:hypothetical protein
MLLLERELPPIVGMRDENGGRIGECDVGDEAEIKWRVSGSSSFPDGEG